MPVSPIETILQASKRTAAEVEHQNGAGLLQQSVQLTLPLSNLLL